MRTLLVIMMMFLASCGLRAEDAPKENTVELRIYDIHNLTNSAPDYPGPDLTLGLTQVVAVSQPAAGFAPKAAPVPTTASIADMLKTRVRPDSWDQALGTSVEEMGGYLVVMQRPEIHGQISELLSAFAESSQAQVAVKGLLIPSATLPDATYFTDDELNKTFGGNAAAAASAAPRVLCLNKQRVHVLSGASFTVVKGADINGDTLDPVVSTLVSGFAFDVRPTLSFDQMTTDIELRATFNANVKRNPRSLGAPAGSNLHATVALHAGETSTTTTKNVNGQNEITASSAHAAGQLLNSQYAVGLEMDLPSMDTNAVRTEVSIPQGKWVLAATLNNPDVKAGKKNLLLFVTAEPVGGK